MVNHQSPTLDRAFHALADPTRRAILFQIAKKESTVSELAEPFDMSLAAVSKHLKVLEEARFISKVKEGRSLRCRLNPEPIKGAADIIGILETFWARKLDSLERYFVDENSKRGEDHGNKRTNKVAPQTGRKKNNPGKKRKSL